MAENLRSCIGGGNIEYTCPTGKVAIISNIAVSLGGASTATISINGSPAFSKALVAGIHNLAFYTGKLSLQENQTIGVTANSTKIMMSILEVDTDYTTATHITTNDYFVFDKATGTILDYNTTKATNQNNLSIPTSIAGITTTSIGSTALNDKNLTGTLTIPNNITSIGYSAFSGNPITGLNLPNNITDIPAYAFSGTAINGTLAIPATVTSIDAYAFYNAPITGTLTIPANCYLGIYAFFNLKATKIVFSGGNYSFGANTRCFQGSSLTEVDLSAATSFSSFNSYVFQGQPITKYIMPANLSGFSQCGDTYGALFYSAYTSTHAQAAGTYEYISGSWTKTA